MDLLQLDGIEVSAVKDEIETYHIEALIMQDLLSCDKCHSNNLIKNGNKITLYRDIPIHGKPIGIYLKRRRYKCKDCQGTIYQGSKYFHDKYLMTKRLYEYIYKKSFKITFVSLANEIGIDEKTVRRIFKETTENKFTDYKPLTPTVLGIDEAHLVGSPRCVLINVKESALIDMLPNRNKVNLIYYFDKLQDKHKIKVVTMDMWRPYRDVVRQILPHAIIVIDKFHVVKLAQEALEKVRKNLRKDLSNKERITLKNDRYLLLKRNKSLDEFQRIILYDWFEKYPVLQRAYILKESFFNIFDLDNKETALDTFDLWKDLITEDLHEYFNPVAKTVTNWKEYIFNYFDYRYTNAATEAINGLIKVMNRNGRGYSFDVLRAKSILMIDGKKMKKTKRFTRRTDMHHIAEQEYQYGYYYGIDISTIKAAYESGNIEISTS
jgi:transposase